ncbi:MAG: DUF885 domain-containing protein [Blastocatellia bacterium]|nr:DUF885 domain-containing protein [Blastocatellia bacterium]
MEKRADTPSKNEAFNSLVDKFFDDTFTQYPTWATFMGLHQYDTKLEDHSKAVRDSYIAKLKEYQKQFTAIEAKDLDEVAEIDRELVISHIKSQLFELEEMRSWERNPDIYSGGVTQSVFGLMSREFASAQERLKAVIAREQQVPKFFETARTNLKNPPKIFTEIALEQIEGIIAFFEKDVPLAFKDVNDEKLKQKFTESNSKTIEALKSYEKFLKEDLLQRSNGDYKIGAEKYLKKLLYDEMVDISLERLLQLGYENLRENQEKFKEVGAKLDASKTPSEILADLGKHHPAPEKLLDETRSMLDGIKQFIVDHKIVTIPSPVPPIVKETPPFMRALTFASMDTPGAYETKAKEAYYNITLPEADWPKERVEDHMAGFNYGTIASTSIHEAYPGHYIQFLWVQKAPTKVRKILGCSSNAEGWAHYTEQMMLDEGYGKEDLHLKLGQLQDALLRNARYIVGIEMHTGKMSYEEAIEFFVKEGYQSKANAEREVKRGTSDPTYLVYTLGKLQILKLREDYKKVRGEKFSLQDFHDTFLKQGFPPIKLIRRIMIGDESSVL